MTSATALTGGLDLLPIDVITNADLLVFFVIGLLAGAHCLGMCGPLVSIYADRMTPPTHSHSNILTFFEVRQHFLFNLGRTIGYAAVGITFGLLGSTFFASLEGVTDVGADLRAVTGFGIGVFILIIGLGYVLRGTNAAGSLTLPGISGVFHRVHGVLLDHVDRLANSPGIVTLGTVHAVLPCPIIYPAYLYAFAIADPVRGGLSLAALGLGTIPTLLAYGAMIGTLSQKHRSSLHRLLGAAFIILAYIPLSHGLMLMGLNVPHLDLPYYQPLT